VKTEVRLDVISIPAECKMISQKGLFLTAVESDKEIRVADLQLISGRR
jgi:hypothetical protein